MGYPLGGKVFLMTNGSNLMHAGKLPGLIPLFRQELGNKQSIKDWTFYNRYLMNLCNLIRIKVLRKTSNEVRMIC